MNKSTEELMATPNDGKLSREERIAKVREAKAAREKELEDKKLDAEIARGELVERLEHELKGREDRDFAIVDATFYDFGFIVVKLGSSLLFKTWQESKHGERDNLAFVAPCLVEPTREKFEEMVLKLPLLLDRATVVLGDLFGGKAFDDAKK